MEKHHAREILAILLRRGEEALHALQMGDFEKANEAFKWRRAAFTNFEYLVKSYDSELNFAESDLQDAYRALHQIDRELLAAMNDAKEVVQRQLQESQQKRQIFSKYRLPDESALGFQSKI